MLESCTFLTSCVGTSGIIYFLPMVSKLEVSDPFRSWWWGGTRGIMYTSWWVAKKITYFLSWWVGSRKDQSCPFPFLVRVSWIDLVIFLVLAKKNRRNSDLFSRGEEEQERLCNFPLCRSISCNFSYIFLSWWRRVAEIYSWELEEQPNQRVNKKIGGKGVLFLIGDLFRISRLFFQI